MIKDTQAMEVLAVSMWLVSGDTSPTIPANLSALCEEWRSDEKLRTRWRTAASHLVSLAEEHGIKLNHTPAKVAKAVEAILTIPARKAYSL